MKSGTKTASPEPTPSARIARVSAYVPFPHVTQWLTPTYEASSLSNSWTGAPLMNADDSNTPRTAASISSRSASYCLPKSLKFIYSTFSTSPLSTSRYDRPHSLHTSVAPSFFPHAHNHPTCLAGLPKTNA